MTLEQINRLREVKKRLQNINFLTFIVNEERLHLIEEIHELEFVFMLHELRIHIE